MWAESNTVSTREPQRSKGLNQWHNDNKAISDLDQSISS